MRTFSFRLTSLVPLTGFALASALALLSVAAWLVVAAANMPAAGTLDPLALGLFTVIWGVGMVAMMFPSLLPMVYALTVSFGKNLESQPSPSWRRLVVLFGSSLFIIGYVTVWTVVGLVFYLAIAGLSLAGLPVSLASFGFWAGLILVGTGLYQFTGFKQEALMKCRSPMSFMFTRWRSGNLGAGVMGADYGLFCTRCCWVLMVGLLVVGAMSLPLMGVFSIIIFLEKIGRYGRIFSKLVGAGFLVLGAVLLI